MTVHLGGYISAKKLFLFVLCLFMHLCPGSMVRRICEWSRSQ